MAVFFYLLMALTISSINVTSIKSGHRNAVVMDYMCTLKTAIICLQECGVDNLVGIKEWRKGVAVWAPSSTSRCEGVGVLINNANVKVVSYEEVVPGTCLSVVLDYVGVQLRIINCYAPADKNERNSSDRR